MATLHLMIGLPCSGKTTAARRLETELGALLLSPDAWHLRLFGNDIHEVGHNDHHATLESCMWEVAARVLSLGTDVILDFGCWARAERDALRRKANEIGAAFRLHYMDVSHAELFRRLAVRNARHDDATFVVPPEFLERYIAIFEPPEADELTA